MRRRNGILVVILSLSLILSQVAAISAADNKDEGASKVETKVSLDSEEQNAEEMLEDRDYKDGELIVTFDNEVSNEQIENTINKQDGDCEKISKLSDENKIAQVSIDEDQDMEEAIESYQEDVNVKRVQPNYRYKKTSADPFLANKSEPTYQYYFNTVKAKDAWTLVESKSFVKTKVAVIDTGLETTHKDLQKTLTATQKSKGYVRKVDGTTTTSKVDPDMDSHGTHVTGIIGATYNNGLGGSGIASGHNNNLVEVMAVGAMSNDGYFYSDNVINSINYSVSSGAKVINMSFGGYGKDYALEETIKKAYAKGVVFVAASGNDGLNKFSNPTDYKEVIAVNGSTVGSNGQSVVAYYSDYGIHKDITAPGTGIASTVAGNSYEVMTGTSMSSPIVSGIAALILDTNKSLTPAQVYNIICGTTSQSSKAATFDNKSAYGFVDAKAAVKAAQGASSAINVSSITMKNSTLTVQSGEPYDLEALVLPATSLKPITWTSSNPSVVAVDGNGQITGLKAGNATITAAAGGKTTSCYVSVKQSNNVTALKVSNESQLKTISQGEYYPVKISYTPSNATIKDVIAISSNPSVAIIDSDGVLSARKPGTTLMTIYSIDKKIKTSFYVTVKAEVSYITLSKSVSQLQVGDKYAFQSKIKRADGTNDYSMANVKWTSTNKSVATVDSNGKITAKKEGVTYIAATYYFNSDRFPVQKKIKLTVAKKSYKGSAYGLKVSKKTYNSVEIKWKAIPTANSYTIQRASSKKGKYKTIKTIKSGSTIKYTDKKVTLGKTYYYKIKANYVRFGAKKSFSYSSIKVGKPALPKTSVTLSSKKWNQITVKWKKVSGATGYVVYRATKKSGKYKAVKIIKSGKTTSYVNKRLRSKKKYYYKVRSYRTVKGKKIYSALSNAKLKTCK